MKRILESQKGLRGIVLVLLLVTLSVVSVIGMSYAGDGGIGDPDDGLQSSPPTGTGGTSPYVDLLILVEALSFVL